MKYRNLNDIELHAKQEFHKSSDKMHDSIWRLVKSATREAYDLGFRTSSVRVHELENAIQELERGCDCEHDYRFGRCQAIINAKELIK